jgi:hypothetical protein
MLYADTTTLSPSLPGLPGSCSRAALADRPAGANSFPSQLESTLRRLRASRLRFSVMRLRLSRTSVGNPTAAEKLVAHMADPHVLVGLWPDCSVVGAFFGPRAVGSVGDQVQVRQIVERCRRAMIEAGEADLMSQSYLLIAHRWTDEVFDLPALIDALDLAEEIAA